MTPRLRELEAKKEEMQVNPQNNLDYIALTAHIRGYPMALDDLRSVLEAARKAAEGHTDCPLGVPCALEGLRNVLSRLEE